MDIAARLPAGIIGALQHLPHAAGARRDPSRPAAAIGATAAPPAPASRPAPSVLARAYRTRAMLAQVRRSALMLLLNEDCGLALVLEDVAALDVELTALGLQPTGLDAAEIALVGHECRQVYREARESAPPSPSHGMSIRWARARQLQADTEVDLLKRLRARDSRLELLMRLNARSEQPAC